MLLVFYLRCSKKKVKNKLNEKSKLSKNGLNNLSSLLCFCRNQVNQQHFRCIIASISSFHWEAMKQIKLLLQYNFVDVKIYDYLKDCEAVFAKFRFRNLFMVNVGIEKFDHK